MDKVTDNQLVTVGQRLKYLRSILGFTQNNFANAINFPRENLSKAENDNPKQGITKEAIGNIISQFGVNYEWLMSGIGDIFQEKSKDNYVEERKITYKAKSVETPDMLGKVPYFDVDVTAGNVQLFQDNKEVPTDYYTVPKEIQDVDFCFKVRGDSMYDKILPGAIVFVKQISDISVIEFGQVFIVITAEQRMVKYVRRHPTKPDDMVLLRSHNNHYDDIDLPKEKITNLLLVKGYLNNYVL